MSDTQEDPTARRPRRAPSGDQRRRDAERSRRALLQAALDEFADNGFDRTRIQDIAARAGVNKQLIAYYFGGKEGLYREIQTDWPTSESTHKDPEAPLAETAANYLAATLRDPRPARLLIWRGLTGDGIEDDYLDDAATVEADLADLRAAQARGEIAPDLDPAFVRMALIAINLAPVFLPRSTLESLGATPESPEFPDYLRTQLQALVRHLAAPE
ncbi:TetR/AcrR family transcriptional regulator [Nocardia panacis]|uniref:TetR/AcrR family transcriptional regulator n=1 Tax=Nocardia panacis TaxID=2340916 RepID=A0A3A4K9E4_9NOCA|nr:TetR family transcriptional regulator [Nocardia panacis]RJO76380.1 TetR/AcrR family transcriptional regulator [Nocardia panacis]